MSICPNQLNFFTFADNLTLLVPEKLIPQTLNINS